MKKYNNLKEGEKKRKKVVYVVDFLKPVIIMQCQMKEMEEACDLFNVFGHVHTEPGMTWSSCLQEGTKDSLKRRSCLCFSSLKVTP